LSKVRIVVSFETEQLTGRSVVWVANRVDWSAAKIIGLYLQWWLTELLINALTGDTGLGQHQVTKELQRVERSVTIVVMA
jgi:hypothetical protein